jgi:hypothetical protein
MIPAIAKPSVISLASIRPITPASLIPTLIPTQIDIATAESAFPTIIPTMTRALIAQRSGTHDESVLIATTETRTIEKRAFGLKIRPDATDDELIQRTTKGGSGTAMIPTAIEE